jgi:hypothetical protein
MAYEFIMLATPATQQKPLEELRRTIVEWAPGLRDKQVFWKRRTSIVKVDNLVPVPTRIDLLSSSDSGLFNADNITNSQTPTWRVSLLN